MNATKILSEIFTSYDLKKVLNKFLPDQMQDGILSILARHLWEDKNFYCVPVFQGSKAIKV